MKAHLIILQFTFLLLFLNTLVEGQSFSNDQNFIKKHLDETNFKKEKRAFTLKPIRETKQSIFIRYNPLVWILNLSMGIYQYQISPQLGSSCPHKPSCSNFGIQAIEKFSWYKGIFLTSERLLRCTGFSISDYPAWKKEPLTGFIIDNPELYQFHKE